MDRNFLLWVAVAYALLLTFVIWERHDMHERFRARAPDLVLADGVPCWREGRKLICVEDLK